MTAFYRYIKELADRLNTLENTVRPSLHTDLYDEGISPRQADEFPSQTAHFSGGLPGSRKRTYSASEGVQGSNYGQPYPQRSGERLPSIGGLSAPIPLRHLPIPSLAFQYPRYLNLFLQVLTSPKLHQVIHNILQARPTGCLILCGSMGHLEKGDARVPTCHTSPVILDLSSKSRVILD